MVSPTTAQRAVHTFAVPLQAAPIVLKREWNHSGRLALLSDAHASADRVVWAADGWPADISQMTVEDDP